MRHAVLLLMNLQKIVYLVNLESLTMLDWNAGTEVRKGFTFDI